MLEWTKEAVRRMGEDILERKSYIVLVCGFGFLAGVIIHGFFDVGIGFFWIYNLFLVSAVAIILSWKNVKARLIFLGAFFVVAGFARFNLSVPEKDYKDFFGREMQVAGVIAEEPVNKIDEQQLIIAPEEIGSDKFSGRTRILITAGLYPKYFYGQKINFTCKLLEPKIFADFDYGKFLSIQNIGAQCFRPEIVSLREVPDEAISGIAGLPRSLWSLAMTNILLAKNFLVEKINLTLHEPFASFLGGLLLGAKNSIPTHLADNFKNTGTAHVIAISGWNITFLGTLFLPVLFHLRVKRNQAFYVMVALIFFYALLTGFGASVLRAAIMGSVAMYAQKSSRLNAAGRGLLYSVTLMFLINPRLIYDAGFWLSASATFGLIYFSGIAQNFFHKIPKGLLRENFATTSAAIIFTLPISLYIFGTVSLWALPVNIVILPFVALAIPLALPAVAASALPYGILPAQILFLPSVAVMSFIVKVINFFGSLPFGIWQIKINFWLMLLAYAALVIFTIKYTREKNE